MYICVCIYIYIVPVFIAALFAIPKTWKQP